MATPLPVLKRSAAELLASCVIDLFPAALLAGGGATDFGFYYDIIAEQPIDDYALPLLEEKMRGAAKQGLEIRTLDMMRENASAFMKHRHQPFLAEKILAHPSNIVQLIQFGSFTNPCEAPYVDTTDQLEFVKLLRVETFSQVLPNGDEILIKRIVGAVAQDKYSLKQQIKALTAGNKHDHRKYAEKRGFFLPLPEISEHSLILGNNGTLLKDFLSDWLKRELRTQGFSLVTTPLFIKSSACPVSENHLHTTLFIDSLIEGLPHNVPLTPAASHAALFNSMSLTANDLPVRLAELRPVVPLGEKPGLWGAFTARLSSADFAHIFCNAEQLEQELISSLQFIAKFTKIFGFEYHWNFSDHGKTTGRKHGQRARAVRAFETAFEACAFTYSSDENSDADDRLQAMAILVDRYGREWNGPTVTVDFDLVEHHSIRYNGPGDEKRTPFLIVRSTFGAIERFAALLLEHHGGNLPFWLAPEQLRVLPVTNALNAYALKVAEAIEKTGFRANADCSNSTIGKKIGAAEKECVPHVVIVGENEEKEGLITLRFAGGEGRQQTMTLNALLERLNEEEPSSTLSPNRKNAKQLNGKSA